MNHNTPVGKLTQSQLQSIKHYMSLQIRSMEYDIRDANAMVKEVKNNPVYFLGDGATGSGPNPWTKELKNSKKSLSLAVATQKAVKKSLAGK